MGCPTRFVDGAKHQCFRPGSRGFCRKPLGLVGTMLMVWFERKIVSGMQNRVGPNKAGPFGLLQTLADGTKLMGDST